MTRFVVYWLLSVTLVGSAFGDYTYKRPVTYAGPIVYSDEKPPVIQFPGPPPVNSYYKPSASSYGGGAGGGSYGDAKSSITYVPLPLDDLPILIYQSKDKPPVHVLNRPSKDNYGSYGGGSGATSGGYYNSNSYGATAGGYNYGGGSNSYAPSSAYGGGGSGGYSGATYGSSYTSAPKPFYIGKPAAPSTVFLPQVKPNSYSYGAGNYGGYSSYGGSGANYGNSYGNTGNSGYGGGSYSYNTAGSGYSGGGSGYSGGGSGYSGGGSGYSGGGSGSSSYYSGPTKQQPPHIVYSGHPPIHVYQQPNPAPPAYAPPPSYSSGGYSGGYSKPQSYANTYNAPPPPSPPKQQPNYVPAPPGYHKPPIIIYQGVRPPVHVYNEPSPPSSATYGGGSSSVGGYSGTATGGYAGTATGGYVGGYSSKNGEQWGPVGTSSQDVDKQPSEVKVVTFTAGDKDEQEVVVVPEQALDLTTEAEQPQQKQETSV